MDAIREKLISLSDKEYADFQAKLLPGISRETIIGVRAPDIKKLASELSKNRMADDFLHRLPHDFYDENMLHAALISKEKDFDRCLERVETFLPYVDNWAVCDCMVPTALKKDKNRLLEKIKEWLTSEKTYTCRFGIKMLMSFFLDEDYKKEYSDWVAEVRRDDYYVKMMAAWYFATAMAKQYESAVRYLENNVLTDWVHNKTIQKSVESFRVSEERKKYLKSLRKR